MADHSTNHTTPASPNGPPRGLLGFMVAMFLIFLLSGGVLFYLMARNNPPGGVQPLGAGAHIVEPQASADPALPDEFVADFYIPPFELVDQDEKPVTKSVFDGRVTVIDFFFTHCPFICPAMTGRFAQLADTFKDEPGVQFLSFSVDPAHDTPARLREYAAQHEADTTRWRFLTGPRDVTWKILEEGLKWGVEERPEQKIKLPTGNEMSNIRHPGWFALIGPDAKVLGIYKYDVEADQKKLAERIRALTR